MTVSEGGCKRHLHLDVKTHLIVTFLKWFVGLQIII